MYKLCVRLVQLEQQIKSCNIDVLGINEIRLKGNLELTTGNGNTVFYSGKENGTDNGVGFVISKEIRNSLQT